MVNFPQIRIKQYPKGWVVERKFTTWYGRFYWKHIISVSGMPDEPWFFSTYEMALENLEFEFLKHIYRCEIGIQ